MRKSGPFFAIAALMTGSALAADADEAAGLLRGLAGVWTGELVYRDYQTDERTTLPVTRTTTLLPDGATLQSLSAFEDGGAGTVYITVLQGLDAKTGVWQSASIRKNRAIETGREMLAVPTPPADATHWTILLTEDGEDDDAPALIRETLTRDGDRLTSLKEVDPKNDGKDVFFFRNEIVLMRQP